MRSCRATIKVGSSSCIIYLMGLLGRLSATTHVALALGRGERRRQLLSRALVPATRPLRNNVARRRGWYLPLRCARRKMWHAACEGGVEAPTTMCVARAMHASKIWRSAFRNHDRAVALTRRATIQRRLLRSRESPVPLACLKCTSPSASGEGM